MFIGITIDGFPVTNIIQTSTKEGDSKEMSHPLFCVGLFNLCDEIPGRYAAVVWNVE